MNLKDVMRAGLGGLLVASAMPPWNLWPFAFIGIAVLMSIASERRSLRAINGLIFGVAWFAPTVAWMYFLTAPGYVVAVLFFAGLHALAAAASPMKGPLASLGRLAAHSLVEILRLYVPFGGLPLATLGIAMADSPFLALARLGGVPLLTMFVIAVGIGVGELASAALTRPQSAQPFDKTRTFAMLGAAVALVAFSAFAPSGRNLPDGEVSVAAVQGGGRQGTSALEVPSEMVTAAHLEATSSISADAGVDVVVWPENAIDVNRESFASSEVALRLASEAQRLGVPFLIGVTEDAEFVYDVPPGNFVNAQYVVTRVGAVTDRYVKVIKVPFGEYLPFRRVLESIGAPVDLIPKDAISGQGPAVVDVPEVGRFGVAISWEIFFGKRVRDAMQHGGELIVNPTNGASYTWSIVQSQQVASSKLRAVESGRWVIQVAPTGYTATVNPEGAVLEQSEISEQRVVYSTPIRRTGNTIYTMFGDLPWLLLAIVLWLVAVATSRRAR